MTSEAVLVPVKAFPDAKERLTPALSPGERETLARNLAEGVLAACAPVAVFVVCEDDAIATWATDLGAGVIKNHTPGLNAAVRHGVATLARQGVERVLVTHADLADPTRLPGLFEIEGIVLVPDLELDGTNAMIVPAPAGFSFSYGPGSFARHLSESERLGEPVTIVRDAGLGLDVDNPTDLARYQD